MLSLKSDCGDESRNSAGNLTELKDLPSLPGVEKKGNFVEHFLKTNSKCLNKICGGVHLFATSLIYFSDCEIDLCRFP